MNEFFQSLGEDHNILWTLLVMGVIAGAAISLYFAWERVLKVVASVLSRRARK